MVLRELLVPLVSLGLLAELDPLALMVTLAQPVLLALLVKTDQRVFVVMLAPQEDRETVGSVDLLVHKERRESLERMARLELMGLQVPRVWLDLVVLLVCLASVEKEASLVSLDPLENLVNKELLVPLVTADLLDLWDPLD